MASGIRIPGAELPGIYGGLVRRMSRKMLGDVPEPAEVMWHNRKVLNSTFALGRKAEKWDQCDENPKSFAHMAVGSLVGCSFCLDLGYFMAHNEGLDEAKVREVPRWREWDAFTPLERDVMRYAEAMSQTPPTVTDEMSARLLEKVTIHRSQVRNSRSHRPATRGRLASAGTARPVVGTTVYAARRRPVW